MLKTHKKIKVFFSGFEMQFAIVFDWEEFCLADFSSQLYIGEPALSLYERGLEGFQKDWSLRFVLVIP